MQKIGQGLIERDLYKFKSDSSKILRMSILTDKYFLLKLLSKNDCIAVRSESDAPYTDRPYVKFGETTVTKMVDQMGPHHETAHHFRRKTSWLFEMYFN